MPPAEIPIISSAKATSTGKYPMSHGTSSAGAPYQGERGAAGGQGGVVSARNGCESFRAWLIDLINLVYDESPSGLPLCEIAARTDE